MSMMRGRQLFLLIALAGLVGAVPAFEALAQSSQGSAPTQRRLIRPPPTEQEKMNAWTVGLAAGLLEGAPLRLGAEMARVVDDGPNLHLLPIVTRGATMIAEGDQIRVVGGDGPARGRPVSADPLERKTRAARNTE